jgi:hypothetical protein
MHPDIGAAEEGRRPHSKGLVEGKIGGNGPQRDGDPPQWFGQGWGAPNQGDEDAQHEPDDNLTDYPSRPWPKDP